MSDVTFTLEQAMAARERLRSALNLPEETFSAAAFVGMVSDEIEKMRAAGHADDATASMIEDATGVRLGAQDIARFYATPDERRHP